MIPLPSTSLFFPEAPLSSSSSWKEGWRGGEFLPDNGSSSARKTPRPNPPREEREPPQNAISLPDDTIAFQPTSFPVGQSVIPAKEGIQ